MKSIKSTILIAALFIIYGCDEQSSSEFINSKENPANFTKVEEIMMGGLDAAEISAYDVQNKQLFVANNSGAPKISVIDLRNPSNAEIVDEILLSGYGSSVNSVAVSHGWLAAAVQANNHHDEGSIIVINTFDLEMLANVSVGMLPDMVTFSPDGSLILCANEGEPNDDYTYDPMGTVTIIDAENDFTATTLDFRGFNSMQSSLVEKGFQVSGPGATLAQDVEPEYIAISDDSQTAWISLQENNGIARIDLFTKKITDVFPLGYKDFSLSGNEIDPGDKDGKVEFRNVKAWGMYQPDGISSFDVDGVHYLISANEGDARAYWQDANHNGEVDNGESIGYLDEQLIGMVSPDARVFSSEVNYKSDYNLGRLKISTHASDANKDGEVEKFVTYGARSFSIWNGQTGEQIFDSGSELGRKVYEGKSYLFDDGQSGDKGVEPEGVTVGRINERLIAFIGLERADAVAIYDISNPFSPQFLQILETGDGPEGIIFVPAGESPNGRCLLVISSENDGVVNIYQTEGY